MHTSDIWLAQRPKTRRFGSWSSAEGVVVASCEAGNLTFQLLDYAGGTAETRVRKVMM